MKFITVRDFRTYPKKIWEDLKTVQEMVITNNGKPIALLTPLSDSDMEDTIKAIRQAKAKISVERMRGISLKRKTYKMTGKDINTLVADARKSR
jgi:antitoxin (DNA-binding transcriptional repressor) of toxin-antitoxin stability system